MQALHTHDLALRKTAAEPIEAARVCAGCGPANGRAARLNPRVAPVRPEREIRPGALFRDDAADDRTPDK